MSNDYEALADRAEAGQLDTIPGTVRRGAEARADVARLLMEATGAASVDEVIPRAVGRPRVGQESGPSPTVCTRVPQALKDQLAALAKREHRTESAVMREALEEYVLAKAG